jgi:predicted SnoaL-like aldol condensation-catalyzing enzyme
MKKILTGLSVLVFLLASCKSSTTGTTASNTSDQNETNIANNAKIYKAIETGDVSAIDTLIATDAVDHDGPNGTEIKGRDSIVKMLGQIHNQVKDLKTDVITSAGNGDYVFSLVHITGTPVDSSMGMGGKNLDVRFVDLVKFKDNKITEHWGFTDDMTVSKEMMEMQSKMNSGDKKKK